MNFIKKTNNFSIVIPVYNEELNIIELFKNIQNLNLNKKKSEIIFIDDCSTDKSFTLLSELRKKNDIILVQHKKNLGQSQAILSGIQRSKFDNILTIDGDGQNPPRDIIKLTEEYFKDSTLALLGGIRAKRKDNLIKIYSSKIANSVRKSFLQDDCTDTGCALKIFDKKIFLSFPFFNGIHRFLPALFKGYGHKTKFIDVGHLNRKHGYSKYNTTGRLFRGIKDMITVKNIIRKYNKVHD